MSTDTIDIANLAQTLFTTLTTGEDFSIAVPDLTGSEFGLPDTSADPLYGAISQLTEADLTSRTEGGTGMFDGLAAALKAHLTTEYEKGRITGTDYAKAHIELSQLAMQTAVQYLLGKDQAYWQAQLVQKQARAADVAAIVARVELEKAKVDLLRAVTETKTVAVNYALTKAQLATAEAQYDAAVASTLQTQKTTEKLEYELVELMPLQKSQLQKQIDALSGQISKTAAELAQITYTTTTLMPAQKVGVDAENSIKAFQLSDILPAQAAGMIEDNAGKQYNNTWLLPAQLIGLQENNEASRAKTLDTRSDGVTPVTGAIGKQKDLQQQQIDSYKRDAETKVAKMLLDTWITQKTMDEGLTPPSSLTDANINSAMTQLRTNLDLP